MPLTAVESRILYDEVVYDSRGKVADFDDWPDDVRERWHRDAAIRYARVADSITGILWGRKSRGQGDAL